MIACAVIGVTLLAGRAHAQLEPEPKPLEPATGEPAAHAGDHAEGMERLTLPKGRLLLETFLEIGLSTGAVGKPISLSPDLWYGYDDKITIGLLHSGLGTTGFLGEPNHSLCLTTGAENGCNDVYRNVELEGRYQLQARALGFGWAAAGGLEIVNLSNPFELSLKAGAVGRWHQGLLAVEVQPSLLVALTERNTNHDELLLPITGLYELTPIIAVSAQIGVVLPFEHTGESYRVPLSLGGHYHVNESLAVTLAFSLPFLITGAPVGGFDGRSLILGGTYAL